MLVTATGQPMPLIAYWLEHGTLDTSTSRHLLELCVLCKLRVTRHQEKKIGDKSRLKLVYVSGLVFAFQVAAAFLSVLGCFNL